MIKINGIQVPKTPSKYSTGIMDLSRARRDGTGAIVINRIATKRKIELTWKHLTGEELSNLLTLVSPVFFTVEYIDPQTNSVKTGTFYCGDRTVGAFTYKNGIIRWKDIRFNLIER
jgi:hypothetical protein